MKDIQARFVRTTTSTLRAKRWKMILCIPADFREKQIVESFTSAKEDWVKSGRVDGISFEQRGVGNVAIKGAAFIISGMLLLVSAFGILSTPSLTTRQPETQGSYVQSSDNSISQTEDVGYVGGIVGKFAVAIPMVIFGIVPLAKGISILRDKDSYRLHVSK